MAPRRGAWGTRTVRATAAAAAVGPGGGRGGGINWDGNTHKYKKKPNILDIVSVTNRVYMKAQDKK